MQHPKTDWLLSAPVTPTNPKADSPLFPFIARLIRGEDLSAQEAVKFFRILTDMRHGSIQIAAAITALRLLLSTRIKTFYSEKPPSTLMTVPVVNAASSDAR